MVRSSSKTRLPARRAALALLASASLALAPAASAQPRVLDESPSVTPLPGEVGVTAELVATYPVGEKPTPGPRGAAPNAVYSNVNNPLNIVFQNGGAAGSGAAAITRLIADDLNRTAGPGTVTSMRFAIGNVSTGSVTARPRIRLYQNQVPANTPGAIIVAYTLTPITLAPNTISVYTLDVPAVTVPNTTWAGITFDAGGSGTALATLSQLDKLGVGLFEPPSVGTSGPNVFQTTSAGSFSGNNPSGSVFLFESFGWELRSPLGACCFSNGPCQLLEETPCLQQGGAFLGVGAPCSACTNVHPFNEPPPAFSRYLLDQVTASNLNAPALPKYLSQQFALPPAPPAANNSAYLDEFIVPYKMVVTRADALITLDTSNQFPSPNGYVLSLFSSVSAAAGDASLQTNVVYTQGYTAPVFRGGGEYELSININSNPWNLSGLKVRVDPAIAASESGERGLPPGGLVLNPGTYHMALMFRASGSWGNGFVSDSTHQDPRYPANNGVQVNPGGGVFPGVQRNTNAPAAYRVLARNCLGDLNSDGSVTTPDLAAFLGLWASGTPGVMSAADLNQDGTVNTADLTIFLGAFGQACR